MIRSLVRMVVLVLISVAVGVGYARYHGLPLSEQEIEIVQDEHERWLEETAIELEEFVHHYELGELVIDARPREEFEQGHLDAPLIMSVPADEAADGYHIDRIDGFQSQPIVLYCASEDCDTSEMLWRALQRWGFSYEVRVYHPGWNGIEAAGLPTVAGLDLFEDAATESDEAGEMPALPESDEG